MGGDILRLKYTSILDIFNFVFIAMILTVPPMLDWEVRSIVSLVGRPVPTFDASLRLALEFRVRSRHFLHSHLRETAPGLFWVRFQVITHACRELTLILGRTLAGGIRES